MADVLRLSLHSLHSSSSSSSSSPIISSLPTFSTSTKPVFLSSKKTSDTTVFSIGGSSVYPLVLRKLKIWKVHATVAETDGPKWWERSAGPNMIDIHSTEEFLNASSEAGEKLVIVEFYGTWCGSCRALFHKLCGIAKEQPDIIFLKVNFDENKSMCKSLNVKVLPYFHFYRGADGELESFSCSLAKFQKLKDAIARHNTARCSIGPPKGVGDLTLPQSSPAPKDKSAEPSSR